MRASCAKEHNDSAATNLKKRERECNKINTNRKLEIKKIKWTKSEIKKLEKDEEIRVETIENKGKGEK